MFELPPAHAHDIEAGASVSAPGAWRDAPGRANALNFCRRDWSAAPSSPQRPPRRTADLREAHCVAAAAAGWASAAFSPPTAKPVLTFFGEKQDKARCVSQQEIAVVLYGFWPWVKMLHFS
mmetsp:Transcript_92975/g.250896  ORF Transcript_92975/g.250896 Transcript_92975/m.250896 type:complete len:121 (+) Transcript_92975:3-365(+)